MVASAQQEQVFRRGLAAVDPVLDVMHIAPRRRTITAGEAAAAVAPHESAPERAGDTRVRRPTSSGSEPRVKIG